MRGVRGIACGLFRVLAAAAAEELLVCRLRAETYQHDGRLPETALCFQAIRPRVAGHGHSRRVRKADFVAHADVNARNKDGDPQNGPGIAYNTHHGAYRRQTHTRTHLAAIARFTPSKPTGYGFFLAWFIRAGYYPRHQTKSQKKNMLHWLLHFQT